MVVVEYRCADGSPFPVEFASDDQAATTWRLEREHARDPATPLVAALQTMAVAGGERAYVENGMEMPPFFVPGPRPMGFTYFYDGPPSSDAMASLMTGCGALVQRHGSALAIWRDACLPAVRLACDELRAAPSDAPLARLAETQEYGQQMTMIPAYVCGNDMRLLEAAVDGVVDDQPPLVAHELTQGYDNETLGADQALWEVAQLAAASPSLGAVLRAEDVAGAMAELRASARHDDFFTALDAFLDEFGARGEAWDPVCPTWAEQGPGFWAQLAQLASPTTPSPRDATVKAAERRQALIALIEQRLASDPERLAKFRRRLERVAPYVEVREGRARWQLVLAGSLRGALLRHGGRLVELGVIDHSDDVFYLLPPEVEQATNGDDLRGVVSQRRVDHDRAKRLVPPEVIGGDAAGTLVERVPSRAITGVAASRGLATGTARVVTDLADAHRVEPGDILVCVMTAPPWTPLFAVAGAVVADTGDIGSHAAIAAREYGIPCVLGLGNATTAIPDGALVRVDGGAGRVELVEA